MRHCAVVLLSVLALNGASCTAQQAGLRHVQTIALAGVERRIDHLAVDLVHRRLFVAALGNNTVEVVDLRTGKRLHTITGLHEPQGVVYAAASNRVFVANAQGGDCVILDGDTFAPVGKAAFSDDADNVRYDAKLDQVIVGYGDGALGIMEAANGKMVENIRLSGHPESFQLEKAGARIFVNVPASGQIAVVDRIKKKVIATWPLSGARSNFPMALDETGHRLFIGCRDPGRVLLYDTGSGRQIGSLSISGDTDDLFYDAADARLYVSCGAGFLDVFKQKDPGHFERTDHMPTASGARTSLFVPELKRLYLAVPHRGGQQAEIRVFEAQP